MALDSPRAQGKEGGGRKKHTAHTLRVVAHGSAHTLRAGAHGSTHTLRAAAHGSAHTASTAWG